MLQIGLLKGKVYNFTIMVIICFVLNFSFIDSIEEKHKLDLLFNSTQMSLLLYNFELYELELKIPKEVPIILEAKFKNPITISLLWLVPGICIIDSFPATLVNSYVSCFTTNSDLFDIDYI